MQIKFPFIEAENTNGLHDLAFYKNKIKRRFITRNSLEYLHI